MLEECCFIGRRSGSREVSYEVSTPVFTGPFDLLLHLITKRQVEIYEISLSEIVDAYVAEIERMEELNLEVATEFLLIAATLIELKSARLLPSGSEVELDEELSLFERRDLLIARILDAKAFKDASLVVQERLAEGIRYSPRVAGIEAPFVDLCPDLLKQVTPERLAAIALRALEPRPEPRVDVEHIHKIKITVGEVMRNMAEEIELKRRTTFRELTLRCSSRIEIAVHFLGILELFKQNLIDIEQFTTFGEVTVIWAPVQHFIDWDNAAAEWEDEELAAAAGSASAGLATSSGPDKPPPSEGHEEVPPSEPLREFPLSLRAETRDSDVDSAESELDDLALVAEIAAELDLELDDDDEPDDDVLVDPKLLDNSDLLREAEDLLTKPARYDGWHGKTNDGS